VDFIDRLHSLPWGVWVALGFTIGSTVLLICSRIAEAEEESRPTAGILHSPNARSAPASDPRILISNELATITPVTGRVLECSLATVSLQAADCLERGTMLSWRPADAPAYFGWATVEVKDVTQDGRYWDLTCRFIRTPPWVTRYLKMAPPSSNPSFATK
jgi:hypothetical protein